MDKELLFSVGQKDIKISYFSGTGPGGQNRNKNQNCVRMQHQESGVIVTGQSHRNREANKKEAFRNLGKHPKFKAWLNVKAQEVITGQTLKERVDEQVEEMMKPENLWVFVKKNGKWVEEVTDDTVG